MTWDETLVLPFSELGKVIGFARRKGSEWWLGIVNGEFTTNISIGFDFLDSDAMATILSDQEGIPNAFVRTEMKLKKTDHSNVELEPGGGYFIRMKMND